MIDLDHPGVVFFVLRGEVLDALASVGPEARAEAIREAELTLHQALLTRRPVE